MASVREDQIHIIRPKQTRPGYNRLPPRNKDVGFGWARITGTSQKQPCVCGIEATAGKAEGSIMQSERPYGYCRKHPGTHRLTSACVGFTPKYQEPDPED